jgi:hypothetical protein
MEACVLASMSERGEFRSPNRGQNVADKDTRNLFGLVTSQEATGVQLKRTKMMPTHKARLVRSIDVLTREVADITALAKKQRHDADSQHLNANELETIGAELGDNAATLKAELKKI